MAWLFLLAAHVVAVGPARAAADTPLQATTDDGRKVILHSDGRWEFGPADGVQAPASTHPAPTQAAVPPAASGAAAKAARPDDRYCQGALFGVGRRICPGDPDYNRGSLNPKLR
jgi:hypothetical protein